MMYDIRISSTKCINDAIHTTCTFISGSSNFDKLFNIHTRLVLYVNNSIIFRDKEEEEEREEEEEEERKEKKRRRRRKRGNRKKMMRRRV